TGIAAESAHLTDNRRDLARRWADTESIGFMTQNDQIDGKFLTSLALRFRLGLRALGAPLCQDVIKKIAHSQHAREVEQASATIEFQTRYGAAIKFCRPRLSAKRGGPVAPDNIKTK